MGRDTQAPCPPAGTPPALSLLSLREETLLCKRWQEEEADPGDQGRGEGKTSPTTLAWTRPDGRQKETEAPEELRPSSAVAFLDDRKGILRLGDERASDAAKCS